MIPRLKRNGFFVTFIYMFCVIIYFCLTRWNQSLQQKSNFISFCIFNYVTHIKYYPLNYCISKFQSSQKNLVTGTIQFLIKAWPQNPTKEFLGLKNCYRCRIPVTSSVKPDNLLLLSWIFTGVPIWTNYFLYVPGIWTNT